MDDLEKKMLKIGLNILKNNPKYIITNVENKIEDVQSLIEEGERLLENESIDDVTVNQEEITKIIEIINEKKELK